MKHKIFGAKSIRRWISSPEGKSTPLLKAIIEDIESLELRLVEIGNRPEEPADLPKLRSEVQRLKRLAGEADQRVAAEIRAEAIVPLREVIRKAVVDALADCGGDVKLAAKALKVGEATLYRKAKRYDVDLRKMRRAAKVPPTTIPEEEHGDHGRDGESGP